MIAGPFADFDFIFGLLIGHTRVDALENLALCQTRVLELRDVSAGHDRLAGQVLVENELHGRIREADELQGDRIHADRVQLSGVRNLYNLRFGESGSGQVGSRIGASEEYFVNMRAADQLDTRVIADPGTLELEDLRYFLVRDIEPLQLLNVTGPHPCLVQWTVIRKRVLVTTRRCEDTHTEKQSLIPHNPILEDG